MRALKSVHELRGRTRRQLAVDLVVELEAVETVSSRS
jgi:hypothetical protein